MNPKDLAGSPRVPLSLIPGTASAQIAVALLSGDLKYGSANWREVPIGVSRYLDAMLRHIAKYRDGEDVDSESGLHHLAHAGATICILLDAIACDSAVDDRPHPAPAAKVMKDLEAIVQRLREPQEGALSRGDSYAEPLHSTLDNS